MTAPRDAWATPPDFWQAVDRLFWFGADVCASADNAKCSFYFDESIDSFTRPWRGVCWCNPGYSDVTPWLQKASNEARQGATVVVLTHAGLATKWFAEFKPLASEIWLPSPRIQFVPPAGVKASSNARDSLLWIFTPWGHATETAIKAWNWKASPARSPTA